MRLKISWLFSMVFLGFAVYYFLETRKLKATIDEHLRVFVIVREELDRKDAELEVFQRASQVEKSQIQETDQLLTIKGEFLGWDGNTVFTLSDGTTWKQAKHDVFFFRARDPLITLEKSGANYFIGINGTGRKVQVKPLR